MCDTIEFKAVGMAVMIPPSQQQKITIVGLFKPLIPWSRKGWQIATYLSNENAIIVNTDTLQDLEKGGIKIKPREQLKSY